MFFNRFYLTWLLLLPFFLYPPSSEAVQQCSDTTSQTIPDSDSAGVSKSLTIPASVTGVVQSLSVTDINLTHGNVGELVLKLTNPAGTTLTLLDKPGASASKPEGCIGKNLTGLNITDEGDKTVQDDCKSTKPAYDNGQTYQPVNALSSFSDTNLAGDWQLTVIDTDHYGSGEFQSWCLTYTERSLATVTLTPSVGESLTFGGTPVSYGESASETINFENTHASQNLKILNYEITGTHADDFSLVSPTDTAFTITLMPGVTQTFDLLCEPQGKGSRTATFSLFTNLVAPYHQIDYPLTCEAIGAGYNDGGASNTLNFGEIDLLTTSGEKTITLSENGDEDLQIKTISQNGTHKADFTITGIPGSLPKTIAQGSGDSLTLKITCTPSEIDQRKAKLVITTNDPDHLKETYTLKCTGKGPLYQSIPAEKVSFGQASVGQPAERAMIIKNAGNDDLQISNIAFSGGGAAAFSLSIALPLTISPTDTGTLPLICEPTAAGDMTATMTVDHNGHDSPSTYEVACEGATDTVKFYSSTPLPDETLTFSATKLGEISTTSFKIFEVGTEDITVDLADSTVHFSGSDPEAFSLLTPASWPVVLAEGERATEVTVQCQPNHRGSHQATLTFTHDAINFLNPSYHFSCQGLGPVFHSYDDTPPNGTLNFGEIYIGESKKLDFKIKNTGDADTVLEIDEFKLVGADKADFTLNAPAASPSAPYTRNQGQKKKLEVQCTPSRVGSRQAQFIITTNDMTNATVTYDLHCTGKRPLGPGYYSSPAVDSHSDASGDPVGEIVLPDVPVGETATATLTVEEIGTSVLKVYPGSDLIQGSHKIDFAVTNDLASLFNESDNSFHIADGSGKTVSLEVSCTPSEAGERTASLHLLSNDVVYSAPTYTLRCEGLQPVYASKPDVDSFFDLGSAVIGTAVQKNLKISNLGSDILIVNLDDPGLTGDTDFTVNTAAFDESGQLRIAVGAQAVIPVTCLPGATGLREATLHFNTNDLHHPNPSYNLQCQGRAKPVEPDKTDETPLNPPPTVATQKMTVVFAGDAEGEVSFLPGGFTCSNSGTFSQCSQDFPIGVTVQLTAKAQTGAKFTGWDKACQSNNRSDETIQVTLDENRTCTATFQTLPPRQIQVQITGQGQVTSKTLSAFTCESADVLCKSTPLPAASVHDLIPTPAPGWRFSHWEGDCGLETAPPLTSVVTTNSGDPDYLTILDQGQVEIVLNTDKFCPAIFTAIPVPSVTLTTAIVEGQGQVETVDTSHISCTNATASCQTTLPQNTALQLSATPEIGYQFTGWQSDCAKFARQPSIKLVLTDSLTHCPASFAPLPQQTLKLTIQGKGQIAGAVNCRYQASDCQPMQFPQNSIQTLIPTAAADWYFSHWQGDCAQATQPTVNVLMATDKACTAVFQTKTVMQPPPTSPTEPVTNNDGSHDNDLPVCPTKGVVDFVCNGEWKTIEQLTVESDGILGDAVLAGKIDNQGWVSDLRIQPSGELNGGTVTGNIENQGLIADIVFRGNSITGGTLSGDIRNLSPVKGKIRDVSLAPHTLVTGGRLAGQIQGQTEKSNHCQPTAQLNNVILLNNTSINHVIIGEQVKFGNNLKVGDCVFLADGTPFSPPTMEIIKKPESTDGTVHLPRDQYLSDTTLQGQYQGDATGLPLLENVTITPNSQICQAIIGDNVENQGTVCDAVFWGIEMRGGKIEGDFETTRGGTLQDIQLGPGAHLTGGNLTGKIQGDPQQPALLDNLFITAEACLSHVILAEGVHLAEGACLGEGVENRTQTPQTPSASDISTQTPTAILIDNQGRHHRSDAQFIPQIDVCDQPQPNSVFLTRKEAQQVSIKAQFQPDKRHLGNEGELLIVAQYWLEGELLSEIVRTETRWENFSGILEQLKPAYRFNILPENYEIPIFQGDLSEARGEIVVYLGYRLADGSIVYNGVTPLRLFVDSTPDACIIYALHDEGLNISKPVQIDLSAGLDGDMQLIGTHRNFLGRDMEGMALHPDDPDYLIASAGDDAKVAGKEQDGMLYTIHRQTGEIQPIGRIETEDGTIQFEQVAGLALHPQQNTLWGWGIVNRADNYMAIIQIDPQTAKARILKQFEHSQLNNITSLAWGHKGNMLYMASGDRLWQYNPNTQVMQPICRGISDQIGNFYENRGDKSQLKLIHGKRGEIEGLDVQPNGWLLIGIDYQASTTSSIAAYDVESCQVMQIQLFDSIYHDLESIVWPYGECNDQSWLNENPCEK